MNTNDIKSTEEWKKLTGLMDHLFGIDKVEPDQSFIGDLGMDELDVVQLITESEQLFSRKLYLSSKGDEVYYKTPGRIIEELRKAA